MRIIKPCGVFCALAACIVLAVSAHADSSYIRRPQGWFLLVPPLTKPDPVTGLRYVDDAAPESKWTGMVIKGYDGNEYDFADQNACQAWKSVAFMKFFHLFSGSDQDRFAAHWLSKSHCAQDDKRRRVITDREQLAHLLGIE